MPLIRLAVAVVAIAVVGFGAITTVARTDKTVDRAMDTADQVVEQASREVRDAAEKTTLTEPGAPLERLEQVAADVKAAVGADGELMELSFAASGSGTVKYRKGEDAAAGFRWSPADDDLQPVDVKLVGDGSLDASVFGVRELDVEALRKVVTAAEDAEPGWKLVSGTLGLDPVDGDVRWSVVGETDTHSGIVYQADADGSGVRKVG